MFIFASSIAVAFAFVTEKQFPVSPNLIKI